MSIPSSGSKYSHLSVRIPSNLNAELAKEARRQGINLNATVNRVLERYLGFDRIADFDCSVIVERQVFEKMVKKIKVEDLEEIAKEVGPKTVRRDFTFFNISPTLDNLISKYFLPMGMFSDSFDLNVSGEGVNVKLVLTHDYGPSWSRFLREYCAGVIESTVGVKPIITFGDNLVVIDFGSRDTGGKASHE